MTRVHFCNNITWPGAMMIFLTTPLIIIHKREMHLRQTEQINSAEKLKYFQYLLKYFPIKSCKKANSLHCYSEEKHLVEGGVRKIRELSWTKTKIYHSMWADCLFFLASSVFLSISYFDDPKMMRYLDIYYCCTMYRNCWCDPRTVEIWKRNSIGAFNFWKYIFSY